MAKPGEQGPRGDERALIERLAEAVAAAYARGIDLSALGDDVIGVSLFEYWDGSDPSHWTPEAGLLLAGKIATADGDVETLWNLYDPPEHAIGIEAADDDGTLMGLGQEVLDLIEERNAYELVGEYYTLLCAALRRQFGVPAATYAGDSPPVEDQLRAQLTPGELAALAARGVLAPPAPGAAPRVRDGLELVLWVPLADGVRHAGVVRDDGALHLMPDLGGWFSGQTLGARPVEVTGDDVVAAAAGLLPDGAVAARVQDLHGVWHDAVVGDGAWLCALPHGNRGGAPPVELLDASGAVIARHEPPDEETTWVLEYETANEPWTSYAPSDDGAPGRDWAAEAAAYDDTVLRTAAVPAWWDAALGDAPRLGQHNGSDAEDPATSLELNAEGGAAVAVDAAGHLRPQDVEHAARTALERRLQQSGLDRREAARRALAARPQALPATLGGRDETFLLLADEHAWAALWFAARPQQQVRVTGPGAPPARLDLLDLRAG